jgi:O-acetyl-ADP-ribose deacetylase (regulator of RNase III)
MLHRMQIQIVRADLISIKVDAIVNPVASRPDNVSGRVPVNSTDQPTSLPVGSAIATSGGNVLCRFIIHAAIPHRDDVDAMTKLRQATWSALQRGEELAVASVALPAMAVGPAGFTLEECARVLVQTAVDFQMHARSLQRVLFCLFGDDTEEAFTRVLEEIT